MVKFKDFSRPLSVFQVISKAKFIYKDFQDIHVYSSTFQTCANPGEHKRVMCNMTSWSNSFQSTCPTGRVFGEELLVLFRLHA